MLFFLIDPDDVEHLIWKHDDGHCWQITINWTRGIVVVIDDFGIIKMKREGLSTQKIREIKDNFLNVMRH